MLHRIQGHTIFTRDTVARDLASIAMPPRGIVENSALSSKFLHPGVRPSVLENANETAGVRPTARPFRSTQGRVLQRQSIASAFSSAVDLDWLDGVRDVRWRTRCEGSSRCADAKVEPDDDDESSSELRFCAKSGIGDVSVSGDGDCALSERASDVIRRTTHHRRARDVIRQATVVVLWAF